jgi:pyrroline-5-carboxylate reductase
MARALLGGLSARGPLTHVPIVVEPSPQARAELESRHAVLTLERPDASLSSCTALIVAVKPQQMREALVALKPFLGDCLLISIAAGIRIESIARWLGGLTPTVRCMPNTPALIGAGITGLFANALVNSEQRALANTLLEAVGETVWVAEEALLDAVTAVSGSGPAYVFYFIEALERAGLKLGLGPEISARLAIATFDGATRLARQSDEPLQILRERVTSKGGTTHRALTELEGARVSASIVDAVQAAALRARELGDEFGRD